MSTRADSATLGLCVCPWGSARRSSVFTPLTPLSATPSPANERVRRRPEGPAGGDCWPLKLLAEYTAPPSVNDLFHTWILLYAHRCTYLIFMRKVFEDKFMRVHEVSDDIRAGVRQVGRAAESQARLNIALTGVCVAALLVAAILVHSARNGVSHGR